MIDYQHKINGVTTGYILKFFASISKAMANVSQCEDMVYFETIRVLQAGVSET